MFKGIMLKNKMTFMIIDALSQLILHLYKILLLLLFHYMCYELLSFFKHNSSETFIKTDNYNRKIENNQFIYEVLHDKYLILKKKV